MATLATMQAYADKTADKLEVTARPALRWHGGDCVLARRGHNAHCHIIDGAMPQGTICIRPGTFRLSTVKGWHYLIAHEVSHLATKSSHSSATFARRMETVGQADYRERMRLRSTRKHRHIYSLCIIDKWGAHMYCAVCRKPKS